MTGLIGEVKEVARRVKELPGDLVFSSRIEKHRKALPQLPENRKLLLEQIRVNGGAVESIRTLGFSGTEKMLEASKRLVGCLPSPDERNRKNFIVEAPEETIMTEPDALLWGLNEEVLDFVENYLGVPAYYRGMVVRRDLADGQDSETRRFHLDGDDRRMLKIIVYLNDVKPNGGGPFEFIPKPLTPARRELKFVEGRVLDSEMEKFVPKDKWRTCAGPAESAVFVDTHAVYHRGQIISERDRYTVFFCYNTRHPRWPESCQPLFSKEQATKKWHSRLNDRQLSSIATF